MNSLQNNGHELIAWHEAGHCVALVMTEIPICGVIMDPQVHGPWIDINCIYREMIKDAMRRDGYGPVNFIGHPRVLTLNENVKKTIHFILRQLHLRGPISFQGAVGALLDNHVVASLAGEAATVIKDLALPDNSKFWSTADGISATSLSCYRIGLFDRRPSLDEQLKLEKYITYQAGKCDGLLRNNWYRVCALQEALLQCQWLDGKEVLNIVHSALPPA